MGSCSDEEAGVVKNIGRRGRPLAIRCRGAASEGPVEQGHLAGGLISTLLERNPARCDVWSGKMPVRWCTPVT